MGAGRAGVAGRWTTAAHPPATAPALAGGQSRRSRRAPSAASAAGSGSPQARPGSLEELSVRTGGVVPVVALPIKRHRTGQNTQSASRRLACPAAGRAGRVAAGGRGPHLRRSRHPLRHLRQQQEEGGRVGGVGRLSHKLGGHPAFQGSRSSYDCCRDDREAGAGISLICWAAGCSQTMPAWGLFWAHPLLDSVQKPEDLVALPGPRLFPQDLLPRNPALRIHQVKPVAQDVAADSSIPAPASGNMGSSGQRATGSGSDAGRGHNLRAAMQNQTRRQACWCGRLARRVGCSPARRHERGEQPCACTGGAATLLDNACLISSWWKPSSHRKPRGKKERLGTAAGGKQDCSPGQDGKTGRRTG